MKRNKKRMRMTKERAEMRFEKFSFGSIRIDGTTHEHDIIIDRGEIRKRQKKPSKQFRDQFGRTPLSLEENHGRGQLALRFRRYFHGAYFLW
jgi:hypothetical protein